MLNEDWKSRLATSIEDSGKSKRQVALDSGNGAGYVHSILSEGKDPTITKLIAVCRAVPVSPLYIIHGINVTPLQEAIITALDENPHKAESILSLLSAQAES